MAYSETPQYTSDIGASVTTGATTLDRRRKYAFGDGVAELMPTATPLFSLATKYAKVPTNDPKFKMLEKRHIYQRRQFYSKAALDDLDWSSGLALDNTDIYARCDANGVTQAAGVSFDTLDAANANWLQAGTVVSFTDGVHTWTAYVSTHAAATTTLTVLSEDGATTTADTATDVASATIKGQVIGSSHGEATGAGAGWSDQMVDTEGYTQIFKTPTPMISGSGLATELRGIKNRFIEIYKESLAAHKLDIEMAGMFGFGIGSLTDANSKPLRFTHGGLPFIGDASGHSTAFTYGGSGYDDFVDFLKEYMTPENGLEGNTRIAFVSRDIIAWLNKIGSDAHSSFLKASFSSSGGQWNLDNVVGAFGLNITKLTTPFGALGFVNHPMLREDSENQGLVVDFNHIKMRPLQGNGINRDTSVYPHVEDNDTDGRVDLIMSEIGFEWDLPETHHRLVFS
jgi:hypothetical protein